MSVRFSDEALSKLRAIHAYIAQHSPVNADAMVDRLTRRAQRTADHPRIGRRVPEYRDDDLREVLERPYRIIYRIRSRDEIEVITVMHYRQLLPEDLA